MIANEPVVERIPDTDPKWRKLFFLCFFMLFPLSGVLLFWTDGHAKIEAEAKGFAEAMVIPLLEEKSDEDMIDLATPEFADQVREGDFAWIEKDLGKLVSYDELDADQSRAREEDDRGVIYAELDFKGKFEYGNAHVHMLVKRLSFKDDREASEAERKTTNDDWQIVELEVRKK